MLHSLGLQRVKHELGDCTTTVVEKSHSSSTCLVPQIDRCMTGGIPHSQGKLENFYLVQAATGNSETPEELAEQVREVTPERIFRAMDTVKLDTVYFLQGKEAAE